MVRTDCALFDWIGSGVVDCTVAVLTMSPAAGGMILTATATVAPAAIEPTLHVTTLAVTPHGPPGPVAENNVTPAGSVSVTTTPDAPQDRR